MSQSKQPIPMQKLFAALQNEDEPFAIRYLYRLSDLEEDELRQLSAVWPKVPVSRRRAMMEDIETLSDENFMLSYVGICEMALKDEDPAVRATSIRTLWDYPDPARLVEFIRMLQQDSAGEVRAAAASALGRFVYEGEIEELPQRKLKQVEEALLKAVNGQDETLVRRRALEALGYSSREEVEGLIKKAYQSQEPEWIASALFAMGRSSDEQWRPHVLKTLDHTLPALRFEAARAAGELEMKAALPRLIELVDDADEDVRDASIWSLSQIGGTGAREILERLYENAENEDEIDYLEDALENMEFTEGLQFMPLFDIDEEDEEDEELIIDSKFGEDFYYFGDFDEEEEEDFNDYDEDEEGQSD